ncbi:HAMP domain-containing histidine kinase [Lampropedia puyangensis]|uniref:histidine kinase n=1 Tax=Lampropedia puyangensis TaxID=1330072 RepID=A0A4V4GS85_9BURK|nr:HAMP domain-containing sensor histidine kinase [Lampropedia puyangensis]THU05116.1 HAMP domain-containing histidine kinase [Lampropedia puyangensis]
MTRLRVPRSIQSRMLLVLVPLLLGISLGVAWYLQQPRDAIRRSMLFLQLPEITQKFEQSLNPADLPAQFMGGRLVYTLYAANGQLQWVYPSDERPRRLRLTRIENEQHLWRWHLRDVGHTINTPVYLADGRILMVSKTDTAERAAIHAVLQARVLHSQLVLLPLAALMAALLMVVVHWALRPARRAAEIAAAITPQTPQRIPTANLPSEILPLAQSANAAMDRLQEALAREHRVLADGAHEMRTPLTVLDLRLQRLQSGLDNDWRGVNTAMRNMRKLVDQLLLLSRQAQPTHTPQASCNLVHVVRDAVALMYPLAQSQDREMALEAPETLPAVYGQDHVLQEAVLCALENAIVHGQGAIELRLYAIDADLNSSTDNSASCAHFNHNPSVVLDVMDQGQGISLDQQEPYFSRFHKGQQNSSGSGLGLAIARRVMDNHGGSIAFIQQSPCVLRLQFCQANTTGKSATNTTNARAS